MVGAELGVGVIVGSRRDSGRGPVDLGRQRLRSTPERSDIIGEDIASRRKRHSLFEISGIVDIAWSKRDEMVGEVRRRT
jgi:hypothetical protein